MKELEERFHRLVTPAVSSIWLSTEKVLSKLPIKPLERYWGTGNKNL
jgi:hypothetical protein